MMVGDIIPGICHGLNQSYSVRVLVLCPDGRLEGEFIEGPLDGTTMIFREPNEEDGDHGDDWKTA